MANRFTKFISKSPMLSKAFQLLPNMNGITGVTNIPHVENNAHNPRGFMIPLQMERIKQDVQTWRLGVGEAENAYYPHRFRMQQMFVDTILEGHIIACLKKRKALTMLKDFKIGKQNSSGQWVENEEATKIFKKKWFKDLLSYGLDAQFYGYSLIQLGDLDIKGKDYNFRNLTILKRWNVSPDRKQLVQIPYQTWGMSISNENYFNKHSFKQHDDKFGISFSEDVDANGVPFDDWMVYVDTPSDTGSSICGFGLLYNVSLYAILLRNNLAHNADYTQMFAAPYRHIKTPLKFDSDEYKTLQQSAANMGSLGYLLTSEDEEIEFITGNNGTGFQSYADLEQRCQKNISKILLGHADAMDSTPGKLGSGQSTTLDQEASPIGEALAVTEKEQDDFVLNFLNDICYHKFKNLGFPLKDDECFYTPNDKEDFHVRKKEDEANAQTATIAQTMKNAGLKMEAKYFTERTGIPAEEIEEQEYSYGSNKQFSQNMRAKLEKTYKAKHKH